MSKDRILIAGFGSIGRRHFRNLRSLGYEDFVFIRSRKGVLDDEETAEWPSFTDLDEALRLEPDIAVISNPTALHVPLARKVAESGCDLFIEKPVSHSEDGRAELMSVAETRKLVTMVGYQFRFHPLLRSLRDQLDRLGVIVSARAEWGEYLPGWHPWEDYRKSYSARRDLGGGVVLTLSHTLDYLYWLFGSVRHVHASTRSIGTLQTDVEDDLAEITLVFDEGVLASVHLDYLQRPPTHRLSILGDEGRASLDFLGGTLDWVLPDGEIVRESAPEDFERNTLFVDEMRHFLKAAATRTASDIPLSDGFAVLDIARQTIEASRQPSRAHAD